jgi:hypothetical protein
MPLSWLALDCESVYTAADLGGLPTCGVHRFFYMQGHAAFRSQTSTRVFYDRYGIDMATGLPMYTM